MASKGAFALSFWFIDDSFCSKWCHGRAIEVVDAKHLVVGRKLGIDVGRTKEIDGDLSLHKELALESGMELTVAARKDSGEVVLELANRTLRWVCRVIVCIGELILEGLGGDGRAHGVGDLIVEFVKDWIDSCSLQFHIASIVPLNWWSTCLLLIGWTRIALES